MERIYQTQQSMLGIPTPQHNQLFLPPQIVCGRSNNKAIVVEFITWALVPTISLSDRSTLPCTVSGSLRLNNDVTDSSGYGNNATVSVVLTGCSGRYGIDVDDYIATSGFTNLRNFTFVAWINIDAVPDSTMSVR